MQEPQRGLAAKCQVIRVVDGDTVDVELRIPARVRLLDCDSPEIRTTDPAEKQQGTAAAEHLRKLAAGKLGTVFIPWEHSKRLDDVFSFGRILGHVWVDGQSLAERQIESGHATDGR